MLIKIIKYIKNKLSNNNNSKMNSPYMTIFMIVGLTALYCYGICYCYYYNQLNLVYFNQYI